MIYNNDIVMQLGYGGDLFKSCVAAQYSGSFKLWTTQFFSDYEGCYRYQIMSLG